MSRLRAILLFIPLAIALTACPHRSIDPLRSPALVKPHGKASSEEPPAAKQPETPDLKASHGPLLWPVKGKVVSLFGQGKGAEENGIIIEAPEGSAVRAAAGGRIGYVGKLSALGNVVLIEHANHLVTVYAHLKQIRTAKGKSVAKGDIIGTVGTSGRVENPSLYFEARSRSKPKNPLPLLGQSR